MYILTPYTGKKLAQTLHQLNDDKETRSFK